MVAFREWTRQTVATTGLLLRSGSALAGMAQVMISGFPTLTRVTQETPSRPPQAKLGRGWVGAQDLGKNRLKAFVRKAFRPGLE